MNSLEFGFLWKFWYIDCIFSWFISEVTVHSKKYYHRETKFTHYMNVDSGFWSQMVPSVACATPRVDTSLLWTLFVWPSGVYITEVLLYLKKIPFFTHRDEWHNFKITFDERVQIEYCNICLTGIGQRSFAILESASSIYLDKHVNVADGGLAETTITFHKPLRSNRGDYRCVARNEETNRETSVEFSVVVM